MFTFPVVGDEPKSLRANNSLDVTPDIVISPPPQSPVARRRAPPASRHDSPSRTTPPASRQHSPSTPPTSRHDSPSTPPTSRQDSPNRGNRPFMGGERSCVRLAICSESNLMPGVTGVVFASVRFAS